MRIFFLKIFMKIFFLNLGCNYLSNAHARNTHDFQKKLSFRNIIDRYGMYSVTTYLYFSNLGS